MLMCCCVWQSRIFFGFFFFPSKNGENEPKTGFLGSIWNLVITFSWIWSLKKVHYLLYSCTNLILGKNLVPEIWAKMLLANEIAGLLNWLNLQNPKMKKPDEKAWWKHMELVEKYWSGHRQKWVWKLMSKDTKTGCISKRN